MNGGVEREVYRDNDIHDLHPRLAWSPALPLFFSSSPDSSPSSPSIFPHPSATSSLISSTPLLTPSCLLSLHALTLPSQACRYQTTRPRPPQRTRLRRTQRSTSALPPNPKVSGTSRISVSHSHQHPLTNHQLIVILRGTKD